MNAKVSFEQVSRLSIDDLEALCAKAGEIYGFTLAGASQDLFRQHALDRLRAGHLEASVAAGRGFRFKGIKYATHYEFTVRPEEIDEISVLNHGKFQQTIREYFCR